MREVPFVRKANNLALATSSSSQILVGLPLQRLAAGFFIFSQSAERPKLYTSLPLAGLGVPKHACHVTAGWAFVRPGSLASGAIRTTSSIAGCLQREHAKRSDTVHFQTPPSNRPTRPEAVSCKLPRELDVGPD